jgi:hypothetical protein
VCIFPGVSKHWHVHCSRITVEEDMHASRVEYEHWRGIGVFFVSAHFNIKTCVYKNFTPAVHYVMMRHMTSYSTWSDMTIPLHR